MVTKVERYATCRSGENTRRRVWWKSKWKLCLLKGAWRWGEVIGEDECDFWTQIICDDSVRIARSSSVAFNPCYSWLKYMYVCSSGDDECKFFRVCQFGYSWDQRFFQRKTALTSEDKNTFAQLICWNQKQDGNSQNSIFVYFSHIKYVKLKLPLLSYFMISDQPSNFI